MIAFDTEQGGLDQFHGVRPFFLSVCGPDGPAYREWAVDPLTRQVQVNLDDVEWLRGVIHSADRVVGHNFSFDARGLEHLGIAPPWDKFEDTLIASHVLFSAPPHNLTHVADVYLDEDMKPFEVGLEKAVKKCRSLVQQARLKEGRGKTDIADLSPLRRWKIAEEGDPGLPSGSGADVWRSDYWLPRAVYEYDPTEPDYAPYATVLRDYALVDAVTTYHLWAKLERLLRERGLWKVYRARLESVPAAYRMERRGMTVDRTVLRAAQEKYGAEVADAADLLVGIAASYGYDLQLPKGATNHNLDDFIFGRGGRTPDGKRDAKLPRTHAPDTLNLPVVQTTESGAPSFGGDARDIWLGETLRKGTKPYLFVETLGRRGELTTGLSYLDGYERFLLPTDHIARWVIHPSFRVCGTQTTRLSSNNPNCFDGETELLTTVGWVRADIVTADHDVAQYHKDTGEIEFVKPQLQVHHYEGDMHHISTEDQIDLMLTPNHRCLMRNRKTSRLSVVTADNFHEDYLHYNAGVYSGGTVSLLPEMVTLICAVQADGSYTKNYKNGDEFGIVFAFTKKRKIDRLASALDVLEVKYTRSVRSNGQTAFYIKKAEPVVAELKRLMPEKQFGSFLLRYDRKTLDLFCQEVFLWDGTASQKSGYFSGVKNNADWVQIVFVLSGSRANLVSRPPRLNMTKDFHYLNVVPGRPYSMTTNYTRELVPWNGPVYCVTVPSSFIVVRRRGRVSVTGNSQNISKKSATNLRNCFVPRPGYELYSFDAANIELRIPAYLAGERELIDVFENPDAAPYYGSYHLFVFDILHPELFAKHGKDVKTLFEDSWYQWVKNGNFARQYGAQERKVDATYRVPGAYRLIARRFPKIDALNRAVIAGANRDGCVFTVPDAEVDPDHGYQVVCRRNARDTISPTVPFAYFVSGTAGWWMNRAMAKVDRLVEAWRADEGYDGHLIATVHDEIVAELPLLQVVERVISGGQTGADQAGLRAGKRCRRTTGGWVGNGFRTLNGPDPSLRDYGLVETGTDDYPTRTEWNVRDSDATIRFASDFNTPGELCTLRAIKKYDKPHLNVSLLNQRPHEEVAAWLREYNVRTLNVAGNSESRCTGIGEYTERFLSAVLELDNGNLPRVRAIRETMESCGTNLGIPTPVKAERHRETWAVGEEVA